jgi:peptide/nickel transport system substrate-binding protein
MKNPFTAFPETLATENSMPVNLRKREELGDDFGVTETDGTGPFTQTTFKPGTEVTVTKWADYPGSGTPWVNNKGPAYLDGIKWVPILEVGNRANEIETGGVNVVKNPAPQDVDRLKANPDLVITEFPALANYWISINHANTDLGFDDLRVRQALSAAIDREGLAQSLYFGHAAATYGPIAPNYKWYEPGVEQFNQFDVDKAKSLLEEAGWTEGSGGIREKAGKKLSWEHINNGGQPTTKAIDEAVVAMLKDVGAEMKVKSLDSAGWGEAVNNADNPPASWGFEWLWSSPVDLLIFFHAYPSDAYNGSIPEIKAAVEAWQTAATDADLEAAAKQFQLAWAEKLPKISLLTTNNIWVAQKSVMGYTPLESNLYPLYNDVWLDT